MPPSGDMTVVGLLRERWHALTTVEPASAEDEAAFRLHQRSETIANWRTLLIGIASLAVLYYPTDHLFFGFNPAIRHAFAIARFGSASVALIVYLLVKRVPVVQAHAVGAIGAVGLFTCVLCGYELGNLGGPGELWFNFLHGLVLVPLGMSVATRTRILWTAGFAFAVFLGYFGLHPEHLRSGYAGSEIGYLLFTAIVGIAGGEQLQRLRRRAFLRGRDASRQARALAELNRQLESRVDEQTAELRALANSVERAREEERARVARELHDELGQELTALRYELKITRVRFARDPQAIAPNLDELEALVARTTQTTRNIVTDLRPKVLDDLGLGAAAEWLLKRLEERSQLACRLSLPPEDLVLDPDVASAAFRVLQEALTNVTKHAHARAVEVTVRDDDGLFLEVKDDGMGFNPAARTGGVGLLGMRERLRAFGGRLEVESTRGKGTVVRARIPRVSQAIAKAGT